MTNDQKHYETVDLPFYKETIEPRLPESVLDFHAHVWHSSHYKINPWKKNERGSKYMVTTTDYTFDTLHKDARRIFPDIV